MNCDTRLTDRVPGRLKPAKWLLFSIIMPLACLLFVCGIIYFYSTSWPQYIELDIPHPGKGNWAFSEKTVQVWADGAKFFIWRRETRVYGGRSGDFDSWASVIAFFDKWLLEHGWERAEHQGDTPCNVYMPESDFLEIGMNGYVVYKHLNSPVYQSVPTVCLAAWPIGVVDGFHIVLLTANPSLWTVFTQGFD